MDLMNAHFRNTFKHSLRGVEYLLYFFIFEESFVGLLFPYMTTFFRSVNNFSIYNTRSLMTVSESRLNL